MSLKGQRTTADFIEWDSMQMLLYKLERDGNYKFCLLVACGCYLGLRISDLLQLKWKQFDDTTTLTIIESKTGKERKIAINPALVEILVRIRTRIDSKGHHYLFINRYGTKPINIQYVNRQLKAIGALYGIAGRLSSHSFRKTLGRRCWSMDNYSEKSLILLQSLFCHSSVLTTKRYLGIRESEIKDIYLNL